MVKKQCLSSVSSKGQVTIPLDVRRRLGIKGGDKVEFIFANGHTVIRPAQAAANPFEKYHGVLPAFDNQALIDRWVAELREDGALS